MILLNSSRRIFLLFASTLGLSGCAAVLLGGGSYAVYERRRILAKLGAESGQITRSKLDQAIEGQVQQYKVDVERSGSAPSKEEVDDFRVQLRSIYEEELAFYGIIIIEN